MRTLATAAIAAATLSLGIAPANAKCMGVGGQGTAITNELATINAKDSLALALAASGAKAKGKVKVSCKYDMVVSTCTARQKACK